MSEFDNLRNDAEQFAEKEGGKELQNKFGIGGQQGQPGQQDQGYGQDQNQNQGGQDQYGEDQQSGTRRPAELEMISAVAATLATAALLGGEPAIGEGAQRGFGGFREPPEPGGQVAIPVQDAPGQQAAAQLRAELLMAVAVGGQRPGQEPGVAFRDEHPDGGELVLTVAAHGGLEVDQAR